MHKTESTFDLSQGLDLLCRDLCQRVPQFGHIAPKQVLFAVSRSRSPSCRGLYARINPLRFADGARRHTRRRGRYRETWQLPVMRHQGHEILYLITILFPRFLQLSAHQRLLTVAHELYHISENFDGDIRRFPGRRFAHGPSRKHFDDRIADFCRHYLDSEPDAESRAVLDLQEKDWLSSQIRITGLQVQMPKALLIAREKI